MNPPWRTYLDKDITGAYIREECGDGVVCFAKVTQIISDVAIWSQIEMKKVMTHILNPLENSEDVININKTVASVYWSNQI